jgi:hypothetical protein
MEKKETLPLHIFPESKIKSLLKQEDIGKIYGTATNLVGNASAIFIQSIINATGKNHITEDDLIKVLKGKNYTDFIQIHNDLLVNIPRYKKRQSKQKKKSSNDIKKSESGSSSKKMKMTLLENSLGEEINLKDKGLVEEDTQGRVIGLGEIVHDDEDYDD